MPRRSPAATESKMVTLAATDSLLIYAAEGARRATGLVTTSSLVDPTPVAFYSTIKGTPDPYRNANDLLYEGIDIVLGGGEQYFTPANATNEGGRLDGHNLLDEAKGRGYTTIRTRAELNNVSTWHTRKLFGTFAPGSFYFSSLQPENRQQPSLAEMTRVAISSLNYNIDGYFLVVEHSMVARAGERNFGKLAVNEVAQVDEAIESAVEYAGPDALVLVTNSYSLGSVAPLPSVSAGDLVASSPTVDADGKPIRSPAIPMAPPSPPAWLAGPGGPAVTRPQAAWLHQHNANGWFASGIASTRTGPPFPNPGAASRRTGLACFTRGRFLPTARLSQQHRRVRHCERTVLALIRTMTLTEIRAALDSRGLRPLKQLGQNFLHDQNLARWLATQAVAELEPDAKVIEIGPGLGAMTSVLLEKKFHVIALEKDRGLCVFLREHFQKEIARGQLDLREGDALETLPQLGGIASAICGNLPYYISTPLLMECVKLPGNPARLFFLMQKEVGQRLSSLPGTKPTARSRSWCRRPTTSRSSVRCPAPFFIRRPKLNRLPCN